MESSVSAFLPDVEGNVSAKHAARHRACKQGPRIAAVRHKPQQQKVSTAGHRHWNDRRVNDRNPEDPGHAQVHKPAKRVVNSR